MDTPEATAPSSGERPFPRLVKYFDERGLDALFNRELKITPPGDFNDPFEFWLALPEAYRTDELRKFYLAGPMIGSALSSPWFKSEQDYRQYVDMICSDPRKYQQAHDKRLLEARLGVIDFAVSNCGLGCFSKEPDPLDERAQYARMLMWGHYGKGHHGLLLEFDWTRLNLPWLSSKPGEENPFRVEYNDPRPEMLLREFDPEVYKREFFQILRRWSQRKSSAWFYENEWRFIAYFNESLGWTAARLVDGRLMHFLSLRSLEGKPATPWEETTQIDVVQRVVIGCRAALQFKTDVLRVLKAPTYRHVHVQEAELLKRDYGLEYKTIRPPMPHTS